jgi:hypothetical protein
MTAEWRYLFNGVRTLPICCVWKYEPETDTKVLVRGDTGRVVERRRAEPRDRQLELFHVKHKPDDSGHVVGPKKKNKVTKKGVTS